jgi:defect-in-organelle-trafficking protein DotD
MFLPQEDRLMKRSFSQLALAVGCSALLIGCGTTQNKTTVQVDPAMVKLSAAADQISQAYRTLSYAESAQVTETGAGATLDYDIEDFPEVWQEVYVLEDDFYGELEPFLRGLSRLAGYNEPQTLGPKPVIPITVTVDRSKKQLAEYLIDVSYQSGSRANVVLDKAKDRLMITYAQ